MKKEKQFKVVLTDDADNTITICKVEDEPFEYAITVEDEVIFGFNADEIGDIVSAFNEINE
jgi:hypothetical protein